MRAHENMLHELIVSHPYSMTSQADISTPTFTAGPI
jgi:hypothetical protein